MKSFKGNSALLGDPFLHGSVLETIHKNAAYVTNMIFFFKM